MRALILAAMTILIASCVEPEAEAPKSDAEKLLSQYATFRLEADLSGLTENERQMLPLLIEASEIMNGLFFQQAFGDPELAREAIEDESLRAYFDINYGPWDRLNGNQPFVAGAGPKPAGANLYPFDITKEEFEAAVEGAPEKEVTFRDLYTLIRRNTEGELIAVPYHEAFAPQLGVAAKKLIEASELAEDPGFASYLRLRADALVTDNYQPSDMAWMDMKDNALDVVIGAIETYEDGLYGQKAAYEGYVLIKDKNWSERLARYATFLPDLQEGLPAPEVYKQEKPGTDSDLNAYDVVYYAGDCNAGSKTIAINLPNDEEVQLSKGTRRLQLKNTMRAKFDKILVPIADVLVVEEQRSNVTFDAFFENTMFHEVAHGLGIKNTLDGKGTVREALQDQASALEEGKADVLGLYMVNELARMGELDSEKLADNMVTFAAGIFRSIRFGASSAHGRANLLRFNYFEEENAFERTEAGQYRVNLDNMESAMNSLSEQILRFQGDGDYDGVVAFVEKYGKMDATLEADLARLAEAGIPVDIVFEQGVQVLGL